MKVVTHDPQLPRLVKAGTGQTAMQAALERAQALGGVPTPPEAAATSRSLREATPASPQALDVSSAPATRSLPTETRRTATGVIVKVAPDRGFAFVRDDAEVGMWAGLEYFVHRAMIGNDAFNALAEGQRVRFDAVMNQKGWRAIRLCRIPAQEL